MPRKGQQSPRKGPPSPSDPDPLGDALTGAPSTQVREAIGQRQENYGHPRDNFGHIAALWHAMFGWEVDAHDVALAMVLMKCSRLHRTPGHFDSLVDIEGYADAYWMIDQPRG